MIGIWLDSFSAFAFGAAIAIPIGIWIGVAHGAQIEAMFTRFRPQPKVAPETARAVLFAIQDQLGCPAIYDPTLIPLKLDPACPPDRIYLTDRHKAENAKRIMILKLDESANKDERA